ncbi:MAG: oligosaccharide flippase family protein [Sediminibacterium sp.]|nr:oligosaccharide flippase family protein [Sediminibacterium sp.]
MNLKNLAKETFWYGFSTIFSRFLNYALTPYITYKIATDAYGEMSTIYAIIPFLNVLITHGMETSFFNFINLYPEKKQAIYNTASWSVIFMAIIFVFLLINKKDVFENLLGLNQTGFIILLSIIISTDAIAAIPFCKLRQESRPIRYTIIKTCGILTNIFFIYYFLSIVPSKIQLDKTYWLAHFPPQKYSVAYILWANIAQNFVVLLLLFPSIRNLKFRIDWQIWGKMLKYSWPLIIVGLGGMVNETFDRIMLRWLAPTKNDVSAIAQVGIYSANYKLAMLITFTVQAFKMGAEPFFFKESRFTNAKIKYAQVLKYFVIILLIMFLFVIAYLPLWKYFIAPKMWIGLGVVPVLLLANMCLGVYYNLSVWFKLSQQTIYGIWITLIGCAITILINYFFIPYFGFMACAYATFFCYASMMLICWKWGQKHYPIPYPMKKIISYSILAMVCFGFIQMFTYFVAETWYQLLFNSLILFGFILWAWFVESKLTPKDFTVSKVDKIF